jgi:hypothetical protein
MNNFRALSVLSVLPAGAEGSGGTGRGRAKSYTPSNLTSRAVEHSTGPAPSGQ